MQLTFLYKMFMHIALQKLLHYTNIIANWMCIFHKVHLNWKNKVIIFFWKQFVYIFSRKKTVDVPCTFIVKNTLKVDTCCKKGKCFFLSTFSPRQYVNKSCTNLLTRIFNLYLCLNEILFSGFTGVAYLSSKGA